MPREKNSVLNYNDVRQLLKHIYLYGFFSREDFISSGLCSANQYDANTKLLRDIMPQIQESAVWSGNKKNLRMAREFTRSSERLLARSFLLHGINKNELTDLLGLLSVLRIGRSRTKLNEELSNYVPEGAYDIARSPVTISRLCKAAEEYGYIHYEMSTTRRKKRRLRESLLASLSKPELTELYLFTAFMCEITYPRVAGSFLQRSIRREMMRHGLTDPTANARNQMSQLNDPFLFRHNRCANILDEEIVYQLQAAIKSRSYIEFLRSNGKVATKVLPIALRIDTRLGRWYLLYWQGRPAITRISNIQEVKETKVTSKDWDTLSRITHRAFSNNGFTAPRNKDDSIVIETELCFGTETGVFELFKREMRTGEIVEKGGLLVYRVAVSDPSEIKPFLRRYSPWIRIYNGPHNLDIAIRKELEEMRDGLEG